MGVNLLAIGLSGIEAAQAEIATTAANISNADNPNYAVESVPLSALAGPQGNSVGVEVGTAQAAQAPFLTADINQLSGVQAFNTALTQTTQAAQVYLEPGSGTDLGQSLQNLFNAFSNLSASPTDPAARQAVIAAAGQFASLAQQLSGNLNQTADTALTQLAPLVQQVNSLSQQVATLNAQITAAGSNGGSTAALVDQRNALVSQLAGLIGATGDASGNVAVAGVPLVSGTTPLTLSLTGTIGGPTVGVGLEVSLANGTVPVPSNSLGGTIGGLFTGASDILATRSAVDNFTASVATAINSQSALGYGLDGSTGNDLFLIPGGNGPIALNPAITVQNLPAASTAAGVPGDGSNASAIAALAGATGLDSSFPSSTPSQSYADIASNFGSQIANAQSGQQQAQASLDSLNTLAGSITGVSVNQQLTELIQYQQTLQAAGRAVQAASDSLSFLLTQLTY